MSRHGQWYQQSDSATLTETLAAVSTIPCAGMERLTVYFSTSNHSALDQFTIQMVSNPSASAVTLYNAAADFTTPSGLIVGASGDLTALAANSTGWLILDVRGVYQIVLNAARAAGSATVLTIEIGGN